MIICYFFVGVSRGSPPAFVWAIIFILFILDITFAVNQYYQQQVCDVALTWFFVSVAPLIFSRMSICELFLISLFVFSLFHRRLLTEQEKGKWADYLHGEYVFCVLSLVAKQLLAWLNFGGAKAL